MYHKVSKSARRVFIRQLDYMRSLGDFVASSEAISLLQTGPPRGERFFCLTFDDGEKSAYDHAVPLLAERNIPSIFFVVPSWIDAEAATSDSLDRRHVNWNECRLMADNGVTVGSHSFSHPRFSTLDRDEAEREVKASKLRLELQLGKACHDFACPWGQPWRDYVPDRDPQLAAAAGYRSFFTTIRGAAITGTSPWAIPRVRLEPEWELFQLRYLFSR